MPARRIDDDFTSAARHLVEAGWSKEGAARALSCCQRTVRRALAAAGAANAVHGDGGTEFAPKPARPGEAAPNMLEALAREAAAGFLPAYA